MVNKQKPRNSQEKDLCIWWGRCAIFIWLMEKAGTHLAVLPLSGLHDSMALNQSRKNRVACQHWRKRQALKLNDMLVCFRDKMKWWHVLECHRAGREYTQTKRRALTPGGCYKPQQACRLWFHFQLLHMNC